MTELAALTAWPALPYEEWHRTRDTLHMYAQVIGKLRLALSPFEPQWENVALDVSVRGLRTPPIPFDARTFDAEKVVGIVSERDIVRALAEAGPGALKHPVADFMTPNVLYGEPGETVDKLLSRMTDRRIRHLPICKNERLVGIVSIGDLVKWKISEVEAEADGLKAYIAAS